MDKVKIRKATVWDAYAITSLWEKEIKEVKLDFYSVDNEEKEKFFLSTLIKMKQQNNMIFVVENSDKKLVGFIDGNIGQYNYGFKNKAGFCEHVYIHPKYRNSNIFKKLLKKLIDWAVKDGVKQLEFNTNYSDKLIRFYKRLGFIPSQIIFRKEV